jgi:hypothetical protein
VLSLAGQVPLLIVHLNTYTPGTILVTVLLYAVGVVIAGEFGPLTKVHKPVPGDGSFPARVVLVTAQSSWSVPASETTVVS